MPASRSRRLAAALVALTLPALAQAETRTITYSILKEGDPIGKETYVIDRDGDRSTVKLTVNSAVHILFLDFTYHHERTEEWTGSTLEKLVADTDDDGSKHHVEAVADGGQGFKVTVDGKPEAVPADAFPLAQWNKAMVGHATLIPVESDDSPYQADFKDAGPETLTVGERKVAAEHYVLSGDIDRDLWYDSDGVLVKAAFRRRGFGIAIVRDN